MNEAIKIYSNGSAHNGKVGTAAVLTRLGHLTRSLHFHLRPEMEHTVHEAELIGTVLALHLIKTEKNKKVNISIGIDNQATLKVYHSSMKKPAHSVAREALCLGNMLKKCTRGKGYSLMLRWTAGHKGIPGNELADKEAKRATEGLSSDKNFLPTFLKRKLTINPSAMQQNFDAGLKQKWKIEWQNSERGQNISKIDMNTPSAHLLQWVKKPSQCLAVLQRLT